MKLILNIFTFFVFIIIQTPSFAHDEGHGPKLKDAGRFGGVVASVVDMVELNKGGHAHLVYKAELVRSQDDTARVYVYDKSMKPLDLSIFSKTAKAVLISSVDGEKSVAEFELTLKGMNFKGKAPKAKSKPYNIEIVFSKGDKKYLVAFDHLD